MNYSIIRYILGIVLKLEGILMCLPLIVGIIYSEKSAYSYVITIAMCLIIGTILSHKKPKDTEFYATEGYITVSLSWVILSIFGCLPFVISGEIPSMVDALFETISGFTTTGASILSDVESLSYCNNMWRCFTHWIGGMGVLVFILAILPMRGGQRMYLMKAESPGPSVEKLVPKVRNTAMILYGIYTVMTFIEVLLLLISGMPLFDALTTSFGTAGTGGFGIKNDSITGYNSSIQIIVTVFMILFGLNFNIYYLILCKKFKQALHSEELKAYLLVIFATIGIITFNIRSFFPTIGEALKHAAFQVGSIITTTGFSTTNFDLWPQVSKTILIMLMFMGACAGSTGGGIKVSRLVVFLKAIKSEVMSITHPRSVQKVQADGRPLSNDAVRRVLCYLGAYVIIVLASILLISLDGKDMTTNLTAVMATFNNIGPGLNLVGPTSNFGDYSVFSKIVLMFDMLVGRLEIFPLLILFAPGLWTVPKRRLAKKKKNFE